MGTGASFLDLDENTRDEVYRVLQLNVLMPPRILMLREI